MTQTTEGVPTLRADFRHFLPIPTRWMDNDIYGHVNNVVYYSYFDTVINRYLIDEGGLDIRAHAAGESGTIGLCVESHCKYMKPIAFPDDIDAGMRVAHLGRSSVRYEIGIFARGEPDASASGWFVHVFVDARTRRSAPIPDSIRAALQRIT
jgi:acyl-CoA thioester hydrolase